MLIEVLKFLHLLCILGVLGSTLYCLRLITAKKFAYTNNYKQKIAVVNRCIMWLVVFSILTGTLLVHPKNYTFHTPWIRAAYLLIFVFSFGMGLLQILRKKFPQLTRAIWLLIYGLLLIVLMALIHDAVTKTPFY